MSHKGGASRKVMSISAAFTRVTCFRTSKGLQETFCELAVNHQRELTVSQASLQLLIPLDYLQYYLERLLQVRRLPNVIYSPVWLSRQIFDLLSNAEKSFSPLFRLTSFLQRQLFLGVLLDSV